MSDVLIVAELHRELAELRKVYHADCYVHDTTGYSAAENAIIPPPPTALRELSKAVSAYRQLYTGGRSDD